MQTPIYITPIDAPPEERSRFIQTMYQDVSYTPEQVEALDTVIQLHHCLGSTYGGPQPMTELSPVGEIALSHGWLVRTAVGYEPTIGGLLIAGDLREQAGYSRIYEPWDEEMAREKARPSNFVPPESVPEYYVLNWLQQWERQGVMNKTVIHDGYCYPLLAKPEHFELYPSVRFPQELVTSLCQQHLAVEHSDGLYLTVGGKAFLTKINDAIAEELREAEEQYDAELVRQGLCVFCETPVSEHDADALSNGVCSQLAHQAQHRKESNALHATVCATGPAHEPEDKNGTEDGFTDCLGCGIVLWAGYAEDEGPDA